MERRYVSGWLLGFTLPVVFLGRANLTAFGQTVPATSAAETSYCQYVESTANDQRQTLMLPRVVASLAKENLLSGQSSGVATSTVRGRLGAEYKLEDIFHGVAVRSLARADCNRYRASATLVSFLELGEQGLLGDALSAKLAVLEPAIPVAEALLSRTRVDLAAFRTTSTQMDALSTRLDRLRAAAEESREILESAVPVGATPPPATSLLQAIHDQQVQDLAYERSLGQIRHASVWDVRVDSGYEHLSNVQAYSPYYWSLNLDVSLGLFSRRHPEETAAIAHSNFLVEDPSGLTHRANALLRTLELDLAHDQKRLRENTALLNELEDRYDNLKLIKDERAASYADDLWFEVIDLRAEHEYLRMHINTLRKVVGQTPSEMVVTR